MEREEMSEFGRRKSSNPQFFFIVFALSISLQITQGLSQNPLSSQNEVKSERGSSSASKTGLTVFLACIGVATLALLSVFLFKIWQKKRREEQHARFIKLFEEDDELEDELGLRD